MRQICRALELVRTDVLMNSLSELDLVLGDESLDNFCLDPVQSERL